MRVTWFVLVTTTVDVTMGNSDQRLKDNIEFLETKNGINWYSYTYIWDKATKHIGVMAQDLLKTKYASAVSEDSRGFYKVNYNKIPF